MRIGIFIPIKETSKRVPNKNFTRVGQFPLYEHTFRTANALRAYVEHIRPEWEVDFYCDTDYLKNFQKRSEIVGDCDYVERNDFILSMAENGINYIERDEELSKDTASGDDLLRYHATLLPDYDIYCQLYITCPFQKSMSIYEALFNMIEGADKLKEPFDSAFLIHENYTWYWYDGKPVNYTPGKLLRSQDAKPVVNETTGFYALTREAWEETQCRIGKNPYMHPVPFVESVDIDNLDDLYLARALADAGL